MGKFGDLEHHFRCFREEIGAMLEFNILPCFKAAPRGKLRQLGELIILYTRHGFLPESYYNYRLFDKPGSLSHKIAGYISDKDRYRKMGTVNESYKDLLRNKWLFHKFFEVYKIPVPTLYGNYHFQRGRWADGSRLQGAENLSQGLRALGFPSLVVKPVMGSGGYRVLVFVQSSERGLVAGNGQVWSYNELAKALGAGDFLLESKVDQHPQVAAIYPHSLNTVRINILNDDREIMPWAAVLRVGTSRSGAVDNWGQGGLSIALDVRSGRLGRGVANVRHVQGLAESVSEHPDTGYTFTGQVLPHWDSVLEVVSKASGLVPGLPYVAWDVAITPTGCMIIEGNNRPDVNLLQVHGGLLKDERHSRWWQNQFGG